jgi:hypothetical protein
MQSFASNVLPFFPVLSLAELCYLNPALSLAFQDIESLSSPISIPRTIATLAVCAIASLYRKVPRNIRVSLLSSLQGMLGEAAGLDLTRRSSLGHVQTMLLLGMSPELHAGPMYTAGSRSWLMTGSAIRMALDIVSGKSLIGLRSLRICTLPD